MKKEILYKLAVFCFFLWWGGFTFYAAFVIPTGQKILGDHLQMGLISQQVSTQLNYIAFVAFSLLVVNEFADNEYSFRKIRLFAKICLPVMIGLVVFLILFHPLLDCSLDPLKKVVLDKNQFYFLHRIYLIVSSILWLIGSVYIALLLRKR